MDCKIVHNLILHILCCAAHNKSHRSILCYSYKSHPFLEGEGVCRVHSLLHNKNKHLLWKALDCQKKYSGKLCTWNKMIKCLCNTFTNSHAHKNQPNVIFYFKVMQRQSVPISKIQVTTTYFYCCSLVITKDYWGGSAYFEFPSKVCN
jgi:hypothetical protein